ncbi:flagellar filament capping protein FliD [Novosphingobium sp. ST904]|uniref:flagellar filament capping protein FliD n=1 Tax=Novosphingobium sp. ST904 TaxID=1684385 RepID=UPI0006C8B8A6|nr:flagellar filament capping protein FliD [Novosphingobium sp. ST904]KPH64452.1 flagellar hook protein [Novosphingobium sp. ST904]TCM31082.1 flagellar hook-associated protein 2 [Novosphingobium sp. ST904]
MATTTSTSLTTSSLVTALGGGSGVDMAALANNLAAAQFANRSDRLTARSDKLTTQISTASNIKSMMLSLSTSLGTLVRSGDLSRSPTVANSAVAAGTLTGSAIPRGTYSLEVTQLASGQQLAGKAFAASTAAVGAGTLTLRFGTVAGGGFTADTAHAAVDVTIAAGATLADVAKAINAANSGVSAYVAQTVDGAQLVLKGQEGAANGFVLETTSGLSDLAWNPSSTNGQLLASAKDAAFKIDGLQMTAKSNTVSDAIPGVKLQLKAANIGAPTTVSFADPTTSIAGAMQDLTDALNEVMSALNTATAIGGDLAADSGARALKRALSGFAGTTIMPNATGMAKTLADLGLKTQRDGTFALDTDRLNATIAADPEGVAAMFTNGLYGVYASYDKIYRAASSATDGGSLGGSISRYTKQLTQIAEDKTDLAEQQEKLRARLATQFTVSETRIGVSKSTLTMLQNQIAQWNKSS